MITLLEQLNYNPPKIEEYQKGDLTVVYDTKYGYYRFWIGPPETARELMTYNTVNHEQAYELYSHYYFCLLYTSPSPRDVEESRMPSSA